MPQQSLDATRLVFRFKRADASEAPATLQTVETTGDLADWAGGALPPIVIGAADSSGPGYWVTVAENGAAADDVTVEIDRALRGSLFVRLKVVK